MMKKLLFSLIFQFSLLAMAQYPISSINISMPSSPAANTAAWTIAMPPIMITAQAQPRNGQVPGDVQECRILVTIKQGGTRKYGTFTPDNAPLAGFTTTEKSWSASSLAGLLGKDVVLPSGSYELCVQFFSNKTPAKPLSNEACKSFTIQGPKDEQYTAPKNDWPKITLTEKEIREPLNFRWTPVLPPTRPMVYRLKVWQLMQGQTGSQAMKINKPVIERDVRDATQAAITGLYTGPCKPPYMCAFIWQVEAIDVLGKVLAVSEATEFKIDIQKELPKEAAKELQRGEFKN